MFDLGPMGYHSGTALLVRVVALLLASASLTAVFAIAGYLYWLHVIAPAPTRATEEVSRPIREGNLLRTLVLQDS